MLLACVVLTQHTNTKSKNLHKLLHFSQDKQVKNYTLVAQSSSMNLGESTKPCCKVKNLPDVLHHTAGPEILEGTSVGVMVRQGESCMHLCTLGPPKWDALCQPQKYAGSYPPWSNSFEIFYTRTDSWEKLSNDLLQFFKCHQQEVWYQVPVGRKELCR